MLIDPKCFVLETGRLVFLTRLLESARLSPCFRFLPLWRMDAYCLQLFAFAHREDGAMQHAQRHAHGVPLRLIR